MKLDDTRDEERGKRKKKRRKRRDGKMRTSDNIQCMSLLGFSLAGRQYSIHSIHAPQWTLVQDAQPEAESIDPHLQSWYGNTPDRTREPTPVAVFRIEDCSLTVLLVSVTVVVSG